MRTAAWMLASLVAVGGCARCGGSDQAAPSAAPIASDAPASAASESAAVPPVPAPAPDRARDVPEVRDAGPGRATAALRAALTGHGLEFDAAEIERACKVGKDGASIDDVEEAAHAHGLDATQTILPVEHVLAGNAPALPAIVVVEGARGVRDFVLLWRLEGEQVQLMHPREGRVLRRRADVARSLHVHEMPVAAAAFGDAVRSEPYRAALLERMTALGVARDGAGRWLERAGAAGPWRGYGALDAALRKLEGDPPKDGAPAAALEATFGCALDARCTSGDAPAPRFWSVHPRAKGKDDGELVVRGTVVLALAGAARR